jgi:hypothetical protein
MQFEGAHIRERAREGGFIDWYVVIVKRHILSSPKQRSDLRKAFEQELGEPVVLMAQDSKGIPTYWGRDDLVEYMARVPMEAVRWQRFTLRAA